MFFVSLHSSKRKFATAQYVNKERFLFPYLHSLFVICSSARATRTLFSSSFLYLSVRLAPSFVRFLFVFCSFIVRLLFVHCSSFLYLPVRLAPSFVRSFFVSPFRYYTPSPWERAGERIFSSLIAYLPVWLVPSFYYLPIVL